MSPSGYTTALNPVRGPVLNLQVSLRNDTGAAQAVTTPIAARTIPHRAKVHNMIFSAVESG